jgi:hypothetical protein
MNPKGPSLVDPQPAAPASRRSLLGIAGLAGAAAVLIGAQRTSAAANQPTAADGELLTQALGVELAVRDLYRLAAAAGADELFTAFAENHRGYADSISAITGQPARDRDEDLYSRYESDFDSSDTASVASAAYEVEQELVATHLGLVGEYEGTDAVTVGTAILVVEGRMATVLAELAGQGDDLDALLGSLEPASGGVA